MCVCVYVGVCPRTTSALNMQLKKLLASLFFGAGNPKTPSACQYNVNEAKSLQRPQCQGVLSVLSVNMVIV